MGLTIVIVGHDMSLVSQVATATTVLNFGKKIAEGTIEEAAHRARAGTTSPRSARRPSSCSRCSA